MNIEQWKMKLLKIPASLLEFHCNTNRRKEMSQKKVTRRKFVAGTAGVAASAMIVPRHVLGGAGYNAPSDTVNFALIGCGGQGKTDAGELVAGNQNLVALCDVDYGYVDREIEGMTRVREGRGGAQ